MHWPTGQEVKVQGHTITKTVTDARLLVTCDVLLRPYAAAAGVGLHVDTTAYVF